ncbi:MAG TPA: radical SAM protein [Candidatus Limnocylindrales bacterium]|nr:radical SAM protein [Candidatus Limnocylindrales bacterium]
MELQEKIKILTEMALEDRDTRRIPIGRDPILNPLNLRPLAYRGSQGMPLMRVLMTNACRFNCTYCPMRKDRHLPRVALEPETIASTYLEAVRKRWADGLFVTTGIPGRPAQAMDQLIKLLEILRFRYRYHGYIHVKIMPGAESAQIERAVQLAHRVSLNLEAPCQSILNELAPEKNLSRSLADLQLAHETKQRLRAESGFSKKLPSHPVLPAGITTQFVVGAGQDTDRQILGLVEDLSRRKKILHHSHFSAFRPIRDTPLENRRETPVLREQRLYQAEYLMREYGYQLEEMVFDKQGNLPLEMDPKVAWAIHHPEQFPVEIQTAHWEQLLRVPGIGPVSVERILRYRRRELLRDRKDLDRLGVVTSRAQKFITLRGKRITEDRDAIQQTLWDFNTLESHPSRTYEFSPGTFR